MIPRATIPPNQRGEPWFEDGNIILLTEDADADTTVAFKVHRGVLARHSEVFQSMFELPSPTATDVEVADDCQVVRMHDPPTELSVDRANLGSVAKRRPNEPTSSESDVTPHHQCMRYMWLADLPKQRISYVLS